MQACAFRWFGVAAGLLLLGIPLSGQAQVERSSSAAASDGQTHLGYPQDWSSRHLLMPGTRAEDILAAGARDPRHVYNMVMRQVAGENARISVRWPPRRIPRRMKSDWAVSREKMGTCRRTCFLRNTDLTQARRVAIPITFCLG